MSIPFTAIMLINAVTTSYFYKTNEQTAAELWTLYGNVPKELKNLWIYFNVQLLLECKIVVKIFSSNFLNLNNSNNNNNSQWKCKLKLCVCTIQKEINY